jgi:type II secretory pathway component PulF
VKFAFKAKDKKGVTREGSVEAASPQAAVDVLQKNELIPLYVEEEKREGFNLKRLLKLFQKVSDKELMLFFKQLSILIEARVPIITALEAVKDQTKNVFFQKVVEETMESVEDGLPFSEALSKNKDVFGNLALSIIKAGEISGNLKKSVDYVARNIEKNYKLSGKIRAAMLYPSVIMVVFVVIGFVFAIFILPRLTGMIKGLDVEIPWYTQIVMNFSDFMSKYWWSVIIGILSLAAGFYYYIRTDEGKRELDELKLRLPIFGQIFEKIYIARFADNLNVLLAGGLPIVRSLTLASTVVNNTVYQGIFLRLADEVKIGGSMSEILKKSKHIPPIVAQIIRIGEETGEIQMVLGYIARFYEQEVDAATKNLSTLIEPILMVIIGVAVAILVFSILMPIYNVANQL